MADTEPTVDPIAHADAMVRELDELASLMNALAAKVATSTANGQADPETWARALRSDPAAHARVGTAISAAGEAAGRLQARLIAYRIAWHSPQLGGLTAMLTAALSLPTTGAPDAPNGRK